MVVESIAIDLVDRTTVVDVFRLQIYHLVLKRNKLNRIFIYFLSHNIYAIMLNDDVLFEHIIAFSNIPFLLPNTNVANY